jgi:hypothetical protein
VGASPENRQDRSPRLGSHAMTRSSGGGSAIGLNSVFYLASPRIGTFGDVRGTGEDQSGAAGPSIVLHLGEFHTPFGPREEFVECQDLWLVKVPTEELKRAMLVRRDSRPASKLVEMADNKE